MTVKLLRCPFCGGNGHTMEVFRLGWQTTCSECHCGTPSAFLTKQLAEIAWNKRKVED